MTIITTLLKLILLFLLAAYIYLIVEEGRELSVWEKSPSTLSFYASQQVCVEKEDSNNGVIETTVTSEVEEGSHHILNCGGCGACSNRNDIRIYHETRNTLTETCTQCAREGFLLGLNLGHTQQCLEQQTGMSPSCIDCWIANVDCNWKHCLKTCAKHKVIPFRWLPSLYKPSHESPLDPCIQCDERMCGPAFVTCAGANRRRVGVVSDLQRDAKLEICEQVDWDWILPAGKEKGTVEEERQQQSTDTTAKQEL